MALRIHPGIVIPFLMNLVLLTGVRFFDRPAAGDMLWPLVIMALVGPWVVSWLVMKTLRWQEQNAVRRRAEREKSDFV